MLEYLEIVLGRSLDSHDRERMQIIKAIRSGRSEDISFPGAVGEFVAKNEELKRTVEFLEKQLVEQRREMILLEDPSLPKVDPAEPMNPRTRRISLGRELRLVRRGLNLSQTQFGEPIPVDQSEVSKWECGKRPITTDTLERICTIYKLPPEQQTRIFLLSGHPRRSQRP